MALRVARYKYKRPAPYRRAITRKYVKRRYTTVRRKIAYRRPYRRRY